MIKVDWKQYCTDYVFLGFYLAGNFGDGPEIRGPKLFGGKINWSYEPWMKNAPWHRCYKLDYYLKDNDE